MNINIVKNEEDLKILLDEFMNSRNGEWWSSFYREKGKEIPFHVPVPDENLVQYVQKKQINIGLALDIGCGNGRNSLYLAQNGFDVLSIDFSKESIQYAEQHHSHEHIEYRNTSIFDFQSDCQFDFIYDGGCLHHISPHRRPEYLTKLKSLLKPDGKYGMEIFNPKGGADLTDYQVYEVRSMRGGIAFPEEKLRAVLSEYFNIIELREMKEIEDGTAFGKDFSWAVLMENR